MKVGLLQELVLPVESLVSGKKSTGTQHPSMSHSIPDNSCFVVW